MTRLNPVTGTLEAMFRAFGYEVDNTLVKITRFTKGRIEVCFVKETVGSIHLIFNPDNFGRLLRAEPECSQIRISKHADTLYPKYSAEDGPKTPCGIGVYFQNEERGQLKKLLRNMETA